MKTTPSWIYKLPLDFCVLFAPAANLLGFELSFPPRCAVDIFAHTPMSFIHHHRTEIGFLCSAGDSSIWKRDR